MSTTWYTKEAVDSLLADIEVGPSSSISFDGGDGLSTAIRVPTPAPWAVVLEDLLGYSSDGFKYITILKAVGKISSPLDDYYAYVAGHNTNGISLFTGPSPVGPWTSRGTITSISSYLSSHHSSPHAIWWNGEVLIYIHGNLSDGSQGTSVFRSSNGQVFTEHTSLAFPTTFTTNPISFLSWATTYLRVMDAGGYLVAVFQANSAYSGGGAVNVPVATGWATSTDGLTWQISDTPLLANRPTERGLFGPYMFKAEGYWFICGYNPDRSKVELWVSDKLEPGTFRYMKDWFGLEAVPGFDWIDAPVIFVDNGVYHIYAGSADTAYVTKGKIHHSILDWSSVA